MASATEAIPIMAGPKAHTWVAEMDAGEFLSHVEIDGDHSFTVINGPSGDRDTVMGGARTVASEVTVRIGERVFAAGSATSERHPAVPPVSADAPPAGRHAVSDRADFEVRAALAWTGGDARGVDVLLRARLPSTTYGCSERLAGSLSALRPRSRRIRRRLDRQSCPRHGLEPRRPQGAPGRRLRPRAAGLSSAECVRHPARSGMSTAGRLLGDF